MLQIDKQQQLNNLIYHMIYMNKENNINANDFKSKEVDIGLKHYVCWKNKVHTMCFS